MPNPLLTTRRADVIILVGADSRLNWSHYMRVLDARQNPDVRAYRISHPFVIGVLPSMQRNLQIPFASSIAPSPPT